MRAVTEQNLVALMQVNTLKSKQFFQSLDLGFEVMYQPGVRVFIDDRLAHDLLRSVCIPTHRQRPCHLAVT